MLLSSFELRPRARGPVIAASILSFACALAAAPSVARADDAAPAASAAVPASAVAQASPAPAASAQPAPVPGGPGGGAQTGKVNSAAPFGHLPVIDIIPIFTNPYPVLSTAVYQSPLRNTGSGYQPIDIGGSFRLPIMPYLSATLDRNVEGTLNVPNARVTTAKDAYTIPGFARDEVLVYRLDENIQKLQIEEGLYFRHRSVGGTNTSANPYPATLNSTEAHYAYVGLTYATPSFPQFFNAFFTFNINVDRQPIDHHVSCATANPAKPAASVTIGNAVFACTAAGTFDPNPNQSGVFETDQYVQLTIPFNRKAGVSLSVQDRWGALNFYENAPFPYRWATSQTYIFTKRFNPVFAVSLRDKLQTALPQGAPYVRPNAQHNGAFDILADFKIDTNHLH